MADINYDELASKFGSVVNPDITPTGAKPPWSGMPPKEANELRSKVYTTSQERLNGIRDIVSKGTEKLNLMNQFGELNAQNRTGAAYEQNADSSLVGKLMPEFLRGSAEKGMQSITARIAPNERPIGAGSTSDKDIELYLRAAPSIDKAGDANFKIRQQFASGLDKAAKKLVFMENYFNTYGHLNGADSLWYKQKDTFKDPNLKPSLQYFNEPDKSLNPWKIEVIPQGK